jgi:hypothetical protein
VEYQTKKSVVNMNQTGTHIALLDMLREKVKPEYIIREGIIHVRRIVELVQQRGILFVIRLMVTVIFGYHIYKIFKSSRTFLFGKQRHKYFYHHYNVTWAGERAIEIPIIQGIMERRRNGKILEFGNVLSHYFPTDHDIIDKHERARNVINQDIIDFHPRKKYDLIVSISTLEHVGWDEHLLYAGPEPHKLIHAFSNLTKCLNHDGEMIITFPVGYNPILDQMIDTGKIKFTKLYCMKRVSADNAWCESEWPEIKNTQYDKPFISANGLVVGYYKNSNNRNPHKNSRKTRNP